MTSPFYVGPEQLIRDRSEFARKGIARGRSALVLSCAEGILFVAENLSRTLHKVSEVYDRIGFAAVGRYNEFETMRQAGIRLADMRGYSYDRRDVTARSLANAYAQTLASIFLESNKPYEIELCVAEVGATPADDELFRLTFDGQMTDVEGAMAMGGQTDALTAYLRDHHDATAPLADVLTVALDALVAGATAAGQTDAQHLPATSLEVALLDRTRPRRTFRRITNGRLEELVAAAGPTADEPADETADKPVEDGPAL